MAATTEADKASKEFVTTKDERSGSEAELSVNSHVAPSKEHKTEPEKPQEDEDEYPSTNRQIATVGSLALVIFLTALDRTILATAIPTITDEFNSIQDVGWYASSYMLCMCAFMLLFGRVYAFYNPKVVFMSCIVLFEVGSAVCGSAPNSLAFIFGRAIAGAGSSAIMGGAMLIVFCTVPLRRRPIMQSTMAAIFGISNSCGPLLGGAFTTKVSWRWCFYINLPIGAVVLVFLFFNLKMPPAREASLPSREKLKKLDPLGTFILIPCVTCIVLALEWGGSTYSWGSWRIIFLLVLFGVLFIAFIAVQLWKQENATVPPRVARQRTIAFAALAQFFVGGTMTVVIYYIPIFFQAVQGVNAVESGIRNLALVLALVVASIITGIAVNRVGYYTPFMNGGFAIMTIGCGLITLWAPGVPESKWIGFQVVLGFGLGMGMMQANLAAQTVLTRKDVATGSSIMFFAQTFGGSIFVAIAQSVFENKLISGLQGIAGLDASVVTKVGATDLYQVVPHQALQQVFSAYSDALAHGAFYVAVATSAIACLFSLGMEWKSVKHSQKKNASKPGSA